MGKLLLIALIIGVVLLSILVSGELRRRAEAREQERDRLPDAASDHGQVAEAHAVKREQRLD